jgi:hypothetical protein
MIHRLSPHVMDPEGMLQTLKTIQGMADFAGYTLLAKTVADIYQCETSFITTEYGFDIFLHVPMAKDEDRLKLYLHLPIPVEISENKVLTITPSKPLIAIDPISTKFKVMDAAELATCKKFGGIFLCTDRNVVRFAASADASGADEPDMCVYHLFKEHHAEIKKVCPILMDSPKPGAIPVSANEFYLMSRNYTQGQILCPGKDPRSFSVRHVTKVTLPKGCSARTDTHEVTAAMDVASPIQTVEFTWPSSKADLLGDFTVAEVERMGDYNDNHLVQELPARLDSARRFHEEREATDRHRTIAYAVWSLFLATLLAAAYGSWKGYRFYKTNRDKILWQIPEFLQNGATELRDMMHLVRRRPEHRPQSPTGPGLELHQDQPASVLNIA